MTEIVNKTYKTQVPIKELFHDNWFMVDNLVGVIMDSAKSKVNTVCWDEAGNMSRKTFSWSTVVTRVSARLIIMQFDKEHENESEKSI